MEIPILIARNTPLRMIQNNVIKMILKLSKEQAKKLMIHMDYELETRRPIDKQWQHIPNYTIYCKLRTHEIWNRSLIMNVEQAIMFNQTTNRSIRIIYK